jgi:hypothetical protein
VALKSRLEEERSKARNSLLKDLGFEKASDIAAVLKSVKDKQDAELTEVERLKKQLGEFAPKVERLTTLEARFASLVEHQFGALPDNVRQAIDEVANGNAEERLRMIDVFRKSGLLGGHATQPTDPPAGAIPKPASNGSTAPAPRGAAVRTKYEELVELEKRNPIAASIFYQANQREIEASRPQT